MQSVHRHITFSIDDAMRYFVRRVASYTSDATRGNYMKFLSAFRPFVETVDRDHRQFDRGLVERYEQWQRDRGLSDTYIHKNLLTLRSLYNAARREGMAPPTDAFDLVSSIRPSGRQKNVKKSQPRLQPVLYTGESDRPNWYALKLFRVGPDKIESMIESDPEVGHDVETYTPRRDVISTLASGRTVTRRDVPVIRTLLFFRAKPSSVPPLSRVIDGHAMIYSRIGADRRRHPAVIPDEEMNRFRLVASDGREGLQYYTADRAPRFQVGQHVEVTAGPFKGLTGTVATLDDGTRHLTVTISGLCLVMTPAIPAPFLSPLD